MSITYRFDQEVDIDTQETGVRGDEVYKQPDMIERINKINNKRIFFVNKLDFRKNVFILKNLGSIKEKVWEPLI